MSERRGVLHRSTRAMWMGLAAVLVIGAIAGIVLDQLHMSSAERWSSSSVRL